MYNILLKLPGLNSLCIAPDVFSFLEDPEISQNQAAQVCPPNHSCMFIGKLKALILNAALFTVTFSSLRRL